jgi:hypothetical protein
LGRERTSAVPREYASPTRQFLESGNLIFSVARREDDPDIRRLLRENALGGWVRLSLEREPDAFAADFGLSGSHGIIIARERDSGEAIGICERSARDAFIDGEVRRLPYLGALRVAGAYRHRIRVLRGGFAAVRELLEQPNDPPFALTAITADNATARRVLCAGLPELPSYRPFQQLSTFALRTRAMATPAGIEPATAADLPAIAVLLQRSYRKLQLAPVWTAADLERLIAVGGLRIEDFLIVRRGPGVCACLAVWDQTSVKQTVVHGYAPWLRRLRPLVNLAAPFLAMPTLPTAGSPLRQVYLSHVAVEGNDATAFRALLQAGLATARRRGFDVALAGFATNHSFAAVTRACRAVEYRSLLHIVHWPDGATAAAALASRLTHVEIAVM